MEGRPRGRRSRGSGCTRDRSVACCSRSSDRRGAQPRYILVVEKEPPRMAGPLPCSWWRWGRVDLHREHALDSSAALNRLRQPTNQPRRHYANSSTWCVLAVDCQCVSRRRRSFNSPCHHPRCHLAVAATMLASVHYNLRHDADYRGLGPYPSALSPLLLSIDIARAFS